MPELTLEVGLQEMKVLKQTQWGEVEKSLNQDKVFVNGKLAGYYLHGPKKFAPLAGWDDAMSPAVVEAISKLKGEAAGSIEAPPIVLPAPAEEGSDDE